MENTLKYGLVIQQDYLNGGPTGKPTSGVKISNIVISNVTGTVAPKGRNYYILCGEASCTNMKIDGVSITGGQKGDYCNNRWSGNFQCPTVKPANLN
jgi:polygalacturonase